MALLKLHQRERPGQLDSGKVKVSRVFSKGTPYDFERVKGCFEQAFCVTIGKPQNFITIEDISSAKIGQVLKLNWRSKVSGKLFVAYLDMECCNNARLKGLNELIIPFVYSEKGKNVYTDPQRLKFWNAIEFPL